MNKEERLHFENFLWFVFILLCFLNIDADNIEIDSIHNNVIDNKSNEIFLFTLIVTFFIYLYFLIRNINSYDEINNKKLYDIKVLGSLFFVVGCLLLIYFQKENRSFPFSPS